jgi:hypothetical protein
MAARYNMREEPDGWTVFDVWTGWPAVVAGVTQTELDMEDADDLVDLLNRLHERGKVLSEMGPFGSKDLT